jgi:hypothetical protein
MIEIVLAVVSILATIGMLVGGIIIQNRLKFSETTEDACLSNHWVSDGSKKPCGAWDSTKKKCYKGTQKDTICVRNKNLWSIILFSFSGFFMIIFVFAMVFSFKNA